MTKGSCLAPSTSLTESSFPISAKSRLTATAVRSSTRCSDQRERISVYHGAPRLSAGAFVKHASRLPTSTAPPRKPFGAGSKIGDGSASIRRTSSVGRVRYSAGRIRIAHTGTSGLSKSGSRNRGESFRSERLKEIRIGVWRETETAPMHFTGRSRRWTTSRYGS